jgi:broad specificity phosphatase PhoE
VAVSTHGDIARIVVAHFAGVPLDGFQRIVIDTAAVSVLQIEDGAARVLLVNDTGGLDRFGQNPTPPWEAAAAGRGDNRAQVRG